jgi:hypothetical protein
MVIYSERVKGDASSLPKDKFDSLLADHERRALRSFAISTQPRP